MSDKALQLAHEIGDKCVPEYCSDCKKTRHYGEERAAELIRHAFIKPIDAQFGELLSAHTAEIKHLRTQLAERDAQLAAERAMADRLANTLSFITAHGGPDYEAKHSMLDDYNATRQPTQDKGE